MMVEWRELSREAKIFYIAGLVSAIRLGVMILTGLTRRADFGSRRFRRLAFITFTGTLARYSLY